MTMHFILQRLLRNNKLCGFLIFDRKGNPRGKIRWETNPCYHLSIDGYGIMPATIVLPNQKTALATDHPLFRTLFEAVFGKHTSFRVDHEAEWHDEEIPIKNFY